jgi:hypothetical protein
VGVVIQNKYNMDNTQEPRELSSSAEFTELRAGGKNDFRRLRVRYFLWLAGLCMFLMFGYQHITAADSLQHTKITRELLSVSASQAVFPHAEEEDRRKLQFEGMFDVNPGGAGNKHKPHKRLKGPDGMGGGGGGGGGLGRIGGGGGGGNVLSKQANSLKRLNRPAALTQYVDEVLMGMDRYHMWWTGHTEEASALFRPQEWAAQTTHSEYKNAIFTVAIMQGGTQVHSILDIGVSTLPPSVTLQRD